MVKKTVPKRRSRTKDAAAIVRAIKEAGGSVSYTGKGHLRVTGPKGIAIVGSDPANNSMAQTIKTLQKYAGLTIRI